MSKNKVRNVTRVGLASALVQVGAYTQLGIGTTGFANPCFLIRVVNDSDQDVDVSYDGVTDNDYLRTGETLQITSQTNSPKNDVAALFPIGFKVYVKGVAGNGTIYLAGYYLEQH